MFGGRLIGFGLSHIVWLSLLLLLVAGFGMMRQMASSNTLLQTIVEDEKRGRVMSFYAMAFAGMSPFGSLLAGVLAERFGAPVTVIASGALCIVGAALFARYLPRLREVVRPIYIQLGVLPEMASGIESASDLQAIAKG